MSQPNRRADKPQGQFLKEVRESKGIALERVHEITKIPLDVLRAIEEGYTVRTLSNFYFRAFMKKYAQFLGVDVTEVIEDYHTEKLPEPLNEDAGLEDIPFNLEKVLPKEKQQVVVKAVGILVILFIVFKIGGCVKQSFSRPKKVRKIVQVKKSDTKQVEDAAVNAKEESQAEKIARLKKSKPAPEAEAAGSAASGEKAPVAAPAAPAITKPVSMTVKARNKVWLQVKVDGNVVFQSTLNKGVAETWQADERIELSGSNISDLEFEVNGQTLGQLGRADRKARRIVVTKDGMTVKK